MKTTGLSDPRSRISLCHSKAQAELRSDQRQGAVGQAMSRFRTELTSSSTNKGIQIGPRRLPFLCARCGSVFLQSGQPTTVWITLAQLKLPCYPSLPCCCYLCLAALRLPVQRGSARADYASAVQWREQRVNWWEAKHLLMRCWLFTTASIQLATIAYWASKTSVVSQMSCWHVYVLFWWDIVHWYW